MSSTTPSSANKHTGTPPPDGANAKPMTDEADIGSGEKTPSQLETEELIRQIPPLKSEKDRQAQGAGQG